MSEKQLFEVFSPKSCEVAAVPTILKTAIIHPKHQDQMVLDELTKDPLHWQGQAPSVQIGVGYVDNIVTKCCFLLLAKILAQPH